MSGNTSSSEETDTDTSHTDRSVSDDEHELRNTEINTLLAEDEAPAAASAAS
jgi:hypothetical protein